MTRATVCKVCGAPRDNTLPYVMRFSCYAEYKMQHDARRRRKKGVTERKPFTYRAKAESRELHRAYARLGLVPGNVWRMVPR